MARPRITGVIAAALLLCIASSAWARPGTVVLKSGQKYEGEVTDRKPDGQVDVVSGGKKYTFSSGAVDRIDYDESAPASQPPPAQPAPGAAAGGMTPEQEYQKRRAGLAPNDAPGRVRLARWAFERQQLDLAADAVDEALRIDPRNAEAQDLQRTIDAQRRLNRRGGQNPPAPGGRPPADMPDATRPAGHEGGNPAHGGAALRPLDPDEINRIRLLEWHNEKGVRVQLKGDVKRRYLSRARNVSPADFNNMDAAQQGWEIKKHDPEMANDVRIVNDPPAMHEWRTQVQRVVLSGCGTTACHGGGAGSDRLALFPRADREPEAYANFLALHQYKYKPKKGREAYMIDRDRPEDSLLIQFGLPLDASNQPHPDVPGFKPILRSPSDPKYREAVKWISKSLSPLREDYGIEMGGEPGKPPAARPAAGQQPADNNAPDDAGADQPPPDQTGQPGQRPAPPPRQGQAPPPVRNGQ